MISKNCFVTSLNRYDFVISKCLFVISQNNFYSSVLWKNDSSIKYLKCMRTLNEHRQSRLPIDRFSAWIKSVSVSHFCRGWGNTPTEAVFMGVITSSVANTSYFMISRNLYFYIKNHLDFLISQTLICDITKSNLLYIKSILKKKTILWYQKIEFVISQNRFFDRFCDITNSIFWYHK